MTQITIFEVPAGSDPSNLSSNDTWGSNTNQIWNRISIDSNTVYFNQNVQANTLVVGQVTINSSALSIGNLVVNTTTSLSGVSNSQLQANLANYAQLSGAAFTGTVNTGPLNVTGDATFSGNVTFSNLTQISPTTIITGDKNIILANGDSTGILANGAGIIIANVASWIYNNANNSWISNVNIQAANISGVLTTTSQPYITANNALNLGGYGLSTFQTAAGLSSNVITLTSNNTNYVGTISSTNVVSNAQLQANLANYTNTTQISSTYQTIAGLAANVAGLTSNLSINSNNSTYLGGNPVGFYANVTNPTFSSNISIGISGNTITINSTVITIGNSTVNATINSTAFSGYTTSTSENANNSAYLGGIVASAYQTTSGLSSNVLTLTSNNTNYVGTISAANVVSNAQLQANLSNYTLSSVLSNYQTTAGLVANVAGLTSNNALFFNGLTTAAFANSVSPIISNNVTIGNSTINTVINSTSISANLIISSNGLYITNSFSGTYVDGAVIDYVQGSAGNVRISGGQYDNISFYNNGVGNTLLASINGNTSIFTVPNIIVNYNNVSSNYNIASNDAYIIVSAPCTLTLPSAINTGGLIYKIKSLTSGNVVINTSLSQTIDGQSNLTITNIYTAIEILSTNSNWVVF